MANKVCQKTKDGNFKFDLVLTYLIFFCGHCDMLEKSKHVCNLRLERLTIVGTLLNLIRKA